MDEMQETGKWYEDVPYQECKSIIKERLASMSRDFIAIGYYLKYIRDKKLYKEDGYASVWEFAESNYGIKMSTASRWMAMNDKFSQGGNTPFLDDRYRDFGKSQLQEMLYLTDDQMEQAKPNMPAKEIRAIRKPEKKSFEQCAAYKCNGCCDNCHYKDRDDCPYDRTGYRVADWRIEHDKRTQEEHDRVRAEEKLSAYGTEKMVRPENSITDAEGCKSGHYCFSCSMDCQIRQEDRYCMEATLAKPFSCETINVLECLRQDVGDKCQFVNHELAYHRSGDHEPDPCCKECKEPCGYACSRAVRKDTKSVVPAQKEPESIDTLEFSVRVRNVLKMAGIDTIKQLLDTPDAELVKIRNISKRCLDEIHSKLDGYKPEESPAEENPEVLHFTADDESIDNSYGATIAGLIGNYLDNAYKSPDRECEASVFGLTYKVLKRPEVTVFYTEDGRASFDVENTRLEQEYQWRQKNKPKPDIPEIEETEEFAPAQQNEPETESDCPPGIKSCIRQEWGTDPDQQHEGSKECAKCWKDWKKTQKALQGLQKEVQPEQVSGKVIGFEDDESVQKWQELLPDIPLFTESTIKDFLWNEERDLKKYLEVNEANRLPFKVLSRKQMIVAGLRLLLRLTGGGDGHE